MRAVVIDGAGGVRVDVVPEPAVEEPGDAVVRVTTAAICGTDLHLLHGKIPAEPGTVVGHEAVGVVEETGPGVSRFAAGDRVVVSYVNVCGTCWWCSSGQGSLCERSRVHGAGAFGGDLPGAQAELVRVPFADANLLAIPGTVDDDRAVFLADAIPTAIAAATLADVRAGETAAVVGGGPVGLLASQALIGAAPDRVVVLDRDPGRLELARSWGAITIDVREREPEMALAALTDDRGADAVVEAVGTPEAFATALDIVRRGGRIVVAGVFAGEMIELQLGVWWARALQVRFLGQCSAPTWWERGLEALVAGTIDPAPVISHRLSLDEAAVGYELFDRRQATKVLLTP